jgi:hypothetical protein
MSSFRSGDLNAHSLVFIITTADTETEILHDLGRVPLEGFVWWKTSPARIYRGSTAWTDEKIYLRASQSVSGKMLLI